MSKDKHRYGASYIPEPPKESRKRSAGGENGGRIREIEDAIEEIKNSMIKSNRDNLDAMYNIDVDNLDVSFRRLLQSYSDGIVEANASIEAWANATEAGFKAVAEWQDETNRSVAAVQGTANANGAAITSLVQFQKKVEDGTIESIASVSQKADENSADILLLAQWISEADGEIDSLTESTALIKATADENSADIELLTQFRQQVENGTVESISSIKEQADGNSASISSIVQWQKTVENGTISSISSVNQKADANAASLLSIAKWQKTVEDGSISSISAVNQKAYENSADILLLASWKSTADSEIDALVESMAVIEVTANDNEASISQIVEAVGENGGVTAASIVSAVNSAGSSVKISADHVDIDGIARFTNVSGSSDSITTVDGSKIALVADSYGDSISRLEFGKYKYSDDTFDDYTFDSMLHIKTADNEVDNENLARFAAIIQTYKAYDSYERRNYETALKLISCGDMSMESDGLIYMDCQDYMTVRAGYNLRVRASETYSKADNYFPSADDTYMFCTDGIYYNGTKIVST